MEENIHLETSGGVITERGSPESLNYATTLRKDPLSPRENPSRKRRCAERDELKAVKGGVGT